MVNPWPLEMEGAAKINGLTYHAPYIISTIHIYCTILKTNSKLGRQKEKKNIKI